MAHLGAWTPATHPGCVIDPDAGALSSDDEVGEIEFTAFAVTKTPVTGHCPTGRAPGA